MRDSDISAVVRILKKECRRFREPSVTRIARKKDPFRVLISTVISARTKDDVTSRASGKLLGAADTSVKMAKFTASKIARLIYPAGFYKTKGKNIRKLCGIINLDHGGKVPSDMDGLLGLPGVGRKTANLVLGLGFGTPAICVDTHVHRISNRLGYVRTPTPAKTEFVLREKLPKRYWIIYNDLLVTYGQNLCKPIGPRCEECRIRQYCEFQGG